MTMLGKQEIEHRFGFHNEGEHATIVEHQDLCRRFREMAEYLDLVLPESRAKFITFTEMEAASMWSHKAIAEKAPLIESIA